MWPRRYRLCTMSLAFCLIASAQTPVENLRANLTYLASDELEGRGTPSRGLDLAADFIAKQFQQAGLQPAAPDGSYFSSRKIRRGNAQQRRIFANL